jgi:hypothetical protein
LRRIIRLEFKSVTIPTVDFLEKNLLSLKDTRTKVVFPEREAGILKGAFDGLPPWEVFMLILTVGANFATISNLLYSILHNRKNPTDSIVFRFNNKRLEISGDFTKHDIEIILNEFSEDSEDDKLINFLDDARRKELEKEVEHLREVLPDYKQLAEPKGWKKSEKAIVRLKHYQSRKKEIEQRISALEKLLLSNERDSKAKHLD